MQSQEVTIEPDDKPSAIRRIIAGMFVDPLGDPKNDGPLCPDCGADVGRAICPHFSDWLKEINREYEERR